MRPRALPFGFSLVFHGAVLAWVAAGPVREAVGKRPSAYDMAIRGKEDRIVWYTRNRALPEVSPVERRGPSRPPRAEIKAPQSIAATPPVAPRANQLVWVPAPQVRLKAEFRAPNLLAFRVPQPPAPALQPRIFSPPPQRKVEQPPPPALAPPPALVAALDMNTAALPRVPRPEPRAFRPPLPAQRARPAAPVLAAPELAVNQNPRLALPIRSNVPDRLPPRRFDPRLQESGAAATVRPARTANLSAPPQLAATAPATASIGVGRGIDAPSRPEPRAFQFSGTVRAKTAPPEVEPPNLETAQSGSGSLSLAVVGLNPTERLQANLPEGSRDARFSAGPVPRSTGGDGEPVESARIFVPGLVVRNGAPPASRPVLIARSAPTSPENLRRILRESAPVSAAPGTAAAPVRVVPPPDPILAGRTVYSMTIQMPNISSFTGSWLMWFAERGADSRHPSDIEPPVPLHKVDPKYVASAVDERIEGKVRLAAVILPDGSVGRVLLLAHLDDRLDATAREALGKWRFEPARRHGTPVAVDVVVEIPFRLAPRGAR